MLSFHGLIDQPCFPSSWEAWSTASLSKDQLSGAGITDILYSAPSYSLLSSKAVRDILRIHKNTNTLKNISFYCVHQKLFVLVSVKKTSLV